MYHVKATITSVRWLIILLLFLFVSLFHLINKCALPFMFGKTTEFFSSCVIVCLAVKTQVHNIKLPSSQISNCAWKYMVIVDQGLNLNNL